LVRIANNEHRDVHIVSGDTVVISATAIPGNERVVSKTIDNLLRQGAQVLHDKIALVHVHGHASQEELKLILNLTRPQYFVPVHGEHRHLKAHAALANTMGISQENTYVLENGDVLEINRQYAEITGRVTAGPIFVDGFRVMDVKNVVLRDRRLLSKDGIVVIVVTRDKKTGNLLKMPEIVSSGFIDIDEHSEITEGAIDAVMDVFNNNVNQSLEQGLINTKIEQVVGDFLYAQTGRRPMIVPAVEDV
jgi:ribonuclease J